MLEDPPPFTSPLVQTADMDNVVRVVTTADRSTITVAKPIPACPTTQESRKYSMTPHMLRRQPNSTPLTHPNFGAFNTLLFRTSMESLPSFVLLSSRGAGSSGSSGYRKGIHAGHYFLGKCFFFNFISGPSEILTLAVTESRVQNVFFLVII